VLYRFIDNKGTFTVRGAHRFSWYVPLANPDGTLLSAVGPNLSGDIKRDNDRFLTIPASAEDLRSSPACRREFFIRVGRRLYRLSQGPVLRQETGLLYQKLFKRLGPLEAEILNFVPVDRAAEVMQVVVRNRGSRPVVITPTSFIPLYGRSEKNLRDHRHVSSLLNRVDLNAYGVFLKPTMIFDEKGHRLNKTTYYCQGYEGNGLAPAGQFPTLDLFYGQGDIFHPDAVEKDTAPARRDDPSFDGKEACAGLRFRKRVLQPGAAAVYTLILGIEDSDAEIKKTFAALRSPALVKKSLSATQEYWQRYCAGLSFDFGDPQVNGWALWVTLQPTLRRIFGCSFLPHFDYGKGGRGWRDLWQDALTLLLTEPGKAKEIIEKSFRGVRLDGSNATIITKDGFLADRNKISRVWMDHGVWPFLTTRSYINHSGDLKILLKKTSYFRDHQLRRAQGVDTDFRQDDFIQRTPSGRALAGTILEHLLVQNLCQFFNVGSHNIVRLENADWNDGLDMAPDKGESVTFSFMYAHNLADICALLEELKRTQPDVLIMKELRLLLDRLGSPVDYNSYKAKQKRLGEYFDAIRHVSGTAVAVPIDKLIMDLREKARHMSAWLRSHEWVSNSGFFNGYYDNAGRRVEGGRGGRITMMLASQVFAIMSGVASDEQVRRTWRSIRSHLEDRVLGGFRLNTDLKEPALNLGRAYGFAYGDKENGAFFSHMNIMLANALYSRGFIKEGCHVMGSIYRMASSEAAAIPPVLPEYFNSQGKGLYLYLTGSASWYIYTLVEEVLGLAFNLGDIVLKPKLMRSNFGSASCIRVQSSYRGRKLVLTYRRPVKGAGPYSIRKVMVNGSIVDSSGAGFRIPASRLTALRNTIEVTLR
jgi:cellobiose phosphorylase